MKKQYNIKSLFIEETEQLSLDQEEQEVRELFEQKEILAPSQLEKYNNLMPNGAERIFNLIEEEKTHQREMELKQLRYRSWLKGLMIFSGFILGFVLLIGIFGTEISFKISRTAILIWASMGVILGIIFSPYIRSRLSNKTKS